MSKKLGLLFLTIVVIGSALAACTVSPETVQTVVPAVSQVAGQLATSVSTQMAGPVGTQVVAAVTQAGTQVEAAMTQVATQMQGPVGTQVAGLATQVGQAAVNGELLTNTVCVACHKIETVAAMKADEAGWKKFLETHHDMGKLPAEQLDAIVKYLAQKYGK